MTVITDRPRFPVKRDGFYHVSEDDQKILGREKFVAVTEVNSVIGKGGLPYAAARLAAEIYMADPYSFQKPEEVASAVFAKWRRKADLGKGIHSLAEAIAKGGAEPVEAHEGYARAVRSFFTAVNPQPLQIEVNIYNTQHGYSGTADLLAVIGGKVTLADFKTTPQIYDEARIQLAAYKACDWMLAKDGLEPMPAVEQTGVVLLSDDGTYSWNVTDAPLEPFLHAIGLWKYLNRGKA